MTDNERVQAVVNFGFTERQARFLVLVMRHTGVCVPRQYAQFAGTAQGGKCNAFFDRLARDGHARVYGCVHNRARVYHVHDKALYHAIGEPISGYSRQVSPRVAVERLMLLDAVLTTPDIEWLTTKPEKATYWARLTAATADWEAASFAAIKLPAAFPIGLDADGRTILLYLATEPWTDRFRRFLQAHVRLLTVAATWTIRIVFPRALDRVYDAYRAVVEEELQSPLHPGRIRELQWYFEHRRRAAAEPLHSLDQAFMKVAAQQCGTARFSELYRRWLRHGDALFLGLTSPAIADALKTGHGRVESVVMPHSYAHLSLFVGDSHVLTTGNVEREIERSHPKRVSGRLRRLQQR